MSYRLNPLNTGVSVCVLTVSGFIYADTSLRYVNCMDYSTVGTGLCRPNDPIPEAPARNESKVDPVKEFLDNHGKPPREFVEFYLNPTPENAQKWNQSFRAQQMKAANVASAWQAAIKAEKGQVETQNSAQPAVSTSNQAIPPQKQSQPLRAPQPHQGEGVKNTRLGAYATRADQQGRLTYYFSVSEPNSARMSSELASIAPSFNGKYRFTCVDLTPLSDKFQAQPKNRGALPCDWRLPRSGELETYKIQQTPVIVVQRNGQSAEILPGVVAADRLRAVLR